MAGQDIDDRLRQAREVLARATSQPSAGGPRSQRSADDARSPADDAPTSPESGGQADPYAVARAIVLRQLAVAPRSRAQLERKLAQRGCDPAVAAEVLDRMTDVGLVDDVAFATTLVQSRQRTKGLSGIALRAELRDKGIADDIAEAAIGGLDERTERARAEDLVARRLPTMAGLDPDVQARRLAGMLARKGYSSGTIYSVVREAIEKAPEHQRD